MITPSNAQMLQAAIDAELVHRHTALPAKVVEYNRADQSCSVQILLKRAYNDEEGERQLEELPVIPHVPVAFLGGGAYSITFELAVGITGMVVFSEASLDKWLNEGSTAPTDPLDDRRNNLTDAVFWPGLRSFADPVPTAGVHATAMVIRAPLIHAGGSSSLAFDSSVDAVAARVHALEEIVLGTGLGGASSYAGTSVLKGG